MTGNTQHVLAGGVQETAAALSICPASWLLPTIYTDLHRLLGAMLVARGGSVKLALFGCSPGGLEVAERSVLEETSQPSLVFCPAVPPFSRFSLGCVWWALSACCEFQLPPAPWPLLLPTLT